jgi:surface protein
MFQGAGAFNQDISSWSTSKVTDMRYMFKEAAAFYQDITGWTTTSLTTSTGMFTGATAWLDRVQRGDGTGTSTDGPISEWVHKPCLADERALSGWCVPCGGGGIRPAGDDPSSGDTMCAFPDKAALKAAINSCLDATNGDPTGVACCSRPNVDCGAAGTLEMPDWDVSLVTDMQALFAFKADFNGNLSRWDVGSVRNMRDMFYMAPKFVGGDLSSWNTSKVTTMRAMFNGGMGGMFNGDVSTWDVSSVTDMMYMFQGATSFNRDISSWNTSQVTDMRYMFKEAAAFYQDITGWSDASLTTEMFAGATAWLDRVQRRDGTGTSTDGPISDWVHKPCLIDERVQSGWCVPCEYNHVNAEGDDPAASVDTDCDELTCCQSKMKRVGMIIKRK